MEDKKSVYIETTIPGVITARASRDILTAYRQDITRYFWDNERHKYNLFISQYVVEECGRGDIDAAKRRLELVKDIDLAEEYFSYLNIPKQAKTDCFHLAVCVIGKMDYLMSWNMTHLGKPSFAKIAIFNEKRGLWLPGLYTPDVVMDIQKEEEQDGIS